MQHFWLYVSASIHWNSFQSFVIEAHIWSFCSHHFWTFSSICKLNVYWNILMLIKLLLFIFKHRMLTKSTLAVQLNSSQIKSLNAIFKFDTVSWSIGMNILFARRDKDSFTLQSQYTGLLLLLPCVLDSIKPLSLEPGGGWISFFFSFFFSKQCPVVLAGGRTVCIALFVQVGPILCLSRIIKIYKSVYLLVLFLPEWIDIGPALFVCRSARGSGGIKKELSFTWITVSLLFSGVYAFSWCGKNQSRKTLHSSLKVCSTISKDEWENKVKCSHFRHHQCSILAQPPTKQSRCTI